MVYCKSDAISNGIGKIGVLVALESFDDLEIGLQVLMLALVARSGSSPRFSSACWRSGTVADALDESIRTPIVSLPIL